jgi:predicted TIM-barrel fold metal-dependent hydrolase
MIHRRELFSRAVTLGGATLLSHASELAAGDAAQPYRIIDTNVSLFQWPFRRLPLDSTERLVEKLRQLGIDQAWAGSFEGVLHRDTTSVNERLVQACSEYDELVPIGSINPALPGWEKDVELCAGKHKMPGIRIHPNYHGYKLDDPRCIRLVQQATSAGRFVQIAAKLEDSRTQHPLVQVAAVDLTALPKLVDKCSNAKLQILNDRPNVRVLDQLAKADGVFFDVSCVDGTVGIPKLLRSFSSDRVLFGSHAPFLIPEAALIRVNESNLNADQLQSLMWANAQKLVPSQPKPKAPSS